MSDALEDVLRLVADGHLTPEEAAPVIEALEALGESAEGSDADDERAATAAAAAARGSTGRPRALRLEVSEAGRRVVNLRVPLSLGDVGLDRIPGLSADYVNRIRQALDEGLTGPILAVDDDGDGNGVRIVLE
ncbi:MAG: hypothetical protein ACJ76W_00810 [Chloroflexota bacterium]